MIASITGWGLVTPLGLSASENWDNLLAGRHITNHSRVPIDPLPGRARVSQLALIAACEALAQSGWSSEMLRNDQTALVIGTSKGPIETWLTPPPTNSPFFADTACFLGYGLGKIAADLADDLELRNGPRLTLSAACASGLHALIRAVMLLKSGEANRALVVGVESSLHPLFQGCFQQLGVLARPRIGCKPFDVHREGFLMSEAAATICLEAVEVPEPIFKGLCVERFGLGGTAGHLTAGDMHGTVLKHLLNRVIDRRPIDMMHAHGTGTRVNDTIELSAIESALDNFSEFDRPSLYSHKGALGHSLGAAGLVAIVLNCLMHRNHYVLPNVMSTDPLRMKRLTLNNAPVGKMIRRSVAGAWGFGGPIGIVSLRHS